MLPTPHTRSWSPRFPETTATPPSLSTVRIRPRLEREETYILPRCSSSQYSATSLGVVGDRRGDTPAVRDRDDAPSLTLRGFIRTRAKRTHSSRGPSAGCPSCTSDWGTATACDTPTMRATRHWSRDQ